MTRWIGRLRERNCSWRSGPGVCTETHVRDDEVATQSDVTERAADDEDEDVGSYACVVACRGLGRERRRMTRVGSRTSSHDVGYLAERRRRPRRARKARLRSVRACRRARRARKAECDGDEECTARGVRVRVVARRWKKQAAKERGERRNGSAGPQTAHARVAKQARRPTALCARRRPGACRERMLGRARGGRSRDGAKKNEKRRRRTLTATRANRERLGTARRGVCVSSWRRLARWLPWRDRVGATVSARASKRSRLVARVRPAPAPFQPAFLAPFLVPFS